MVNSSACRLVRDPHRLAVYVAGLPVCVHWTVDARIGVVPCYPDGKITAPLLRAVYAEFFLLTAERIEAFGSLLGEARPRRAPELAVDVQLDDATVRGIAAAHSAHGSCEVTVSIPIAITVSEPPRAPTTHVVAVHPVSRT